MSAITLANNTQLLYECCSSMNTS
uniref:Uncharacterized protein n=1 Tax=Anguilla anguilla TaxID=7936 RepID=A0A0E9TFS4_ANGAN